MTISNGGNMRRTLAFAATLLALVAHGEAAKACACCSNDGQRYVGTVKTDAYATGVLADTRFADTAHLYTGEADVADIEGITAKSSTFRLAVTKNVKTWVFDFAQEGGGGALMFSMPGSVTKFEIDPRNREAPGGLGPVLYKEWRLTAKLIGNGMFKGATGRNWQATLILHGRGNSCTDASQFNAWTLVLHGEKFSATLFGNLTTQ
jgi:hypothetical protein